MERRDTNKLTLETKINTEEKRIRRERPRIDVKSLDISVLEADYDVSTTNGSQNLTAHDTLTSCYGARAFSILAEKSKLI